MTSIIHRLGNKIVTGVVLGCLGSQVGAADLALPPGAISTFDEAEALDSYDMPVGPWADGEIQGLALEGQVIWQAIQVPDGDATTLQVLQPLRQQLEAQGYSVLFECADISCGGFDFRFNTDVIASPNMYVNLTDYRYLAAEGPKAERFISLLVSRNAASGYIQMIRVLPIDAAVGKLNNSPGPSQPRIVGDISAALESFGSVILSDLAFEKGSSALGAGEFKSLSELATYLAQNQTRQIMLVGHTDATGSLDGNIALSRRRAASVMDRLISEFGANPAQLSADGVGYLSPIANSLTEEGRDQNRRVEAVLISTE